MLPALSSSRVLNNVPLSIETKVNFRQKPLIVIKPSQCSTSKTAQTPTTTHLTPTKVVASKSAEITAKPVTRGEADVRCRADAGPTGS